MKIKVQNYIWGLRASGDLQCLVTLPLVALIEHLSLSKCPA